QLDKTEARLGRKLPRALRDFYTSYDGVRLFFDTYVLAGTTQLATAEELLRLGEHWRGALYLHDDRRVFEGGGVDDRVLAGGGLERWLAAVMARERILVDAAGEWKEVFDDESGALKPEVRKKRARAGVTADPDSALWLIESAEIEFEIGSVAAATRAL